MASEVKGSVPKFSIVNAKLCINRAWKEVRDKNLWSFLLGEASWMSPAQINTGTVSVTRGLNTITFNVAAIAAINTEQILNASWSVITVRQFRVASGGIYNIVAYNAGTGVATLDRIYSELTNAATQYLIFQCYYPSPTIDLLRYLAVQDMNNVIDLYLDRYNRETLARMDPQRMQYGVSSDVVPYVNDTRAGSATLGYKLSELWPIPNFLNNWYVAYQRTGTDLVLPGDTLPREIQEQTVIARAKYHAYEWAEGNKGSFPEMLKTDWRFLMGAADKEFVSLWREDRRKDRESVDQWFFVRRSRTGRGFANLYFTQAGVANPWGA